MIKDKKKLTLPTIIMGIVVWMITSIALYWAFTQINSQPLSSSQPPTTLPVKTSPKGVRLQPPTSNSPKLEPEQEEKPIIKPRLANNEHKINNKDKINNEDKKHLTENPKKEEDKEEGNLVKKEDFINDSEPNLLARAEELPEKPTNNQDHLPPNNIAEPEMGLTPVPKSLEPQNPLPSSWGTVNEKIIVVETTVSKIIDIVENEIPANVSKPANQNDYLENQKWSTVGDQLIKIEEQMNKSVTELDEIKVK